MRINEKFRYVLFAILMAFSIVVTTCFVGFPFGVATTGNDAKNLIAMDVHSRVKYGMYCGICIFFALRLVAFRMREKRRKTTAIDIVSYILIALVLLVASGVEFYLAKASEGNSEMESWHMSRGIGTLILGWFFWVVDYIVFLKGIIRFYEEQFQASANRSGMKTGG